MSACFVAPICRERERKRKAHFVKSSNDCKQAWVQFCEKLVFLIFALFFSERLRRVVVVAGSSHRDFSAVTTQRCCSIDQCCTTWITTSLTSATVNRTSMSALLCTGLIPTFSWSSLSRLGTREYNENSFAASVVLTPVKNKGSTDLGNLVFFEAIWLQDGVAAQ